MDRQDWIAEQVGLAIDSGQPLDLRGGGTKAFYGNPARGELLDLSGHSGIVEYDPGELVLTCRAGTRLSEIKQVLAENGQHLPFEPPAFGAESTVGGTVACGFSGPGRPWSGSLRDYLLGVKMVNGAGAVVRFGSQVMKNVAGYDVSRLMAGSMGTLGVLLEVSFKVLPRPALEQGLRFECSENEAIRRFNEWSGRPLPLSGAAWWRGRLLVRLSGAVSETRKAAAALGGDEAGEDSDFWLGLREHELEFFDGPGDLWRLSLPPAAEAIDLGGDRLLDWGGAQRWCRSELPADTIRKRAASSGGHATLFRGTSPAPRFHPQPPPLEQLQQRIRRAFDPHRIFNRGRIHPEN